MSAHPDVVESARRVLHNCAEAAARAGRAHDEITLIAACKTQELHRALAVAEAGVLDLGENRVQEAAGKWSGPERARVSLHMLGRVQRNKARKAVGLFDLIHSCDSLPLARRLSEVAAGRRVRVLLEVSIAGEESKAGFSPEELRRAMPEITALQGLEPAGLMTIAPAAPTAEHSRPVFARLRELSVELRRLHPSLGPELSMGMTNDYEVAINEGATMVRVGRGIYGERPTPDGAG